MAILKTKDIRKLEKKNFENKLVELRLELAKERANIAIGASVSSPGKLKELRRAIARMKTIKSEFKNKKEG